MSRIILWPPAPAASNPSIGTGGTTAPTSATEVAGVDGGGVLRPISTDTSGNQNVNVVSSVLPTGASTSALQTSGTNAIVSAIQAGPTSPAHVIVDSSALPTGAATSALQTTGNTSLSSIDTKTPALGQALAAASVPVVLTAAQITTLTPPTTVTANQGAAGASAWKVDGSAVTQPISASALPLPTGASTSALQTTGNASLSSIDSKLTSPITVTGTVTSSNTANGAPGSAAPAQATQIGGSDGTNLRAVKVSATGVVSVDGSAVTQPVSASALPLPTGAATSANQATDQTLMGAVTETAPATDTASSGQNGRLQRIAQRLTSLIALHPASLGQKTSAGSLAVVLASDQSAITVTAAAAVGRTLLSKARIDYSTTNVTTSAYVTLIASVGGTNVNCIEIFDSSGETLVLATGAAASEVDQNYIMPGGNGIVSLAIASGTRVSVKAVTGTAAVGYINVNFYS